MTFDYLIQNELYTEQVTEVVLLTGMKVDI